ncbi:1173_t:CDS:2 [Paraglomus brasilianum]|uniref:1173_t:CDS:1 n=1 Tax=Paraglomus brasilianum TaxID=144538 RepID=A0A9N9B2J3_9GLOM|nr:1173_t:CDS:2 [Paraglomus brasilianum]
MVNEQIQTILNKLDGLTQENPDLVANGISIEQFINECKDNNSPLSAIVNCLLETIREKDEEISKQNQTIANYQTQVQGINARFQRRPRRLSLEEKEKNKGVDQVSSPISFDYSSFSSPRSAHSPLGDYHPSLDIPKLDNVLEAIAQEDEIIEAQEEELNNLRKQVSLLQKQTESQAKVIENFEANKQVYVQGIKEKNAEIGELKVSFKDQKEKVESLKKELKQTENDLYEEGLKRDRLAESLRLERGKNKKLGEQLEDEINNNETSRKKRDVDDGRMLNKFESLMKDKTFAQQQIEHLKELIESQEERYRQEKNERDKEYRKKMENLMRLQSSDDIRSSRMRDPVLRRTYSSSISLPASRPESPRNSFYYGADPSLKSPDLFSELDKADKKGNFFGLGLTDSPNSINSDKGEKSPVEESENQLEQSLQEVMNLVDAKTLKDDYDTLEKALADLRSKQLVEENNRQKLQEEIDSLKYQLAEAKDHQFRAEKGLKDKNEIDKSTTELVAERDQLKERLTTVQNKLDEMYSENAKLAMQKLSEVNRVYEKVRAIEAQLQNEQEDNRNTKIQNQKLLNEIAELKKNNDLSKIGNSIDKLGSATERAKNALDLLKSQIEVDINKK